MNNITYTFAPVDNINPVYCRQCHIHIPILISSQNNGLCLGCVQLNQQPPPTNNTPFVVHQSRNIIPLFITSVLFSVILVVGSLILYHYKVVRPLQAELITAQTDLAQTRQVLSTTQANLINVARATDQALNEAKSSIESVAGTVSHNAEVQNRNNMLR